MEQGQSHSYRPNTHTPVAYTDASTHTHTGAGGIDTHTHTHTQVKDVECTLGDETVWMAPHSESKN